MLAALLVAPAVAHAHDAYVANEIDGDVSVIDTAPNTLAGPDIAVGNTPQAIAITPDGSTAYVANSSDDGVSVIDTATNTPAGFDIAVGAGPSAIAITPNQPPVAELAADPPAALTGDPVAFDASGSSDDEGIVTYRFDFGDGSFAEGPSPTTRTHAYADPGTYDATVTVDDGEGCPGFVFTGQTASCNGPSEVSSGAVQVQVAEPGPFSLRLALERPQRSLRRITATVTCEGNDCEATARGRLRVRVGDRARSFALGPQAVALAADAPRTLSLTVPTNARTAARGALRDGGVVRVRFRVRASVGNREQQVVRVARVRQ
jgi:YVTN family beta-propeller protein